MKSFLYILANHVISDDGTGLNAIIDDFHCVFFIERNFYSNLWMDV